MGKRSKSQNKEDENVIERKKKSDLTTSSTENEHDLHEKNDETEQSTTLANTEIVSNTEDKSLSKRKKRKKGNKLPANSITPNKKIIFDDDAEAHEVLINIAKKKNKKVIQPQEEEPTEEDIDQFCAEIDEEDNADYENWVKLIEAKLSSNKKKT